ncbi:DUF6017 domain-containing protein [Peptoniphilus asaccharolyticus]
MICNTGSKIVDALQKLNITGNVIPVRWYKTVIRENGEPHHPAIAVLGEVVYWYRPQEIVNDATGKIIGYRKKFKMELLQKNYQELSEKLNLTKREVQSAIVFLEKIGVLSRVFKTITTKTYTKIPNVLYLDMSVTKLIELTYAEEDHAKIEASLYKEDHTLECNTYNANDIQDVEDINNTENEVLHQNVTPSYTEMYDTPTPKCNTNTKNTTKSSTEIIFKEEYPSNPIHLFFKVKSHIKEKIDYELLVTNRPYDLKLINSAVELITEIFMQNNNTQIVISGSRTPIELVKQRFNMLEYKHLVYVLECLSNTSNKIRNIKNYLITSLYNSIFTIDYYYQAEANNDLGELSLHAFRKRRVYPDECGQLA